MEDPIFYKKPEELLEIVDQYEIITDKLYHYLTKKFPEIKISFLANKVGTSYDNFRKKEEDIGWNPQQIKKALKLIDDYESIKRGLYEYLTQENLHGLKVKGIAEILKMKERKFLALKKNAHQWKHMEIRAALELVEKWEKL